MSFIDKIRSLFKTPLPPPGIVTLPPSPGTVEFPYGCPECAARIFHQVRHSSEGWKANNIKAETKIVRGIPPFSYSCMFCGKKWLISNPGCNKVNYYHWYVSYRDGSGTLYSIENCPHCNAQLSSYERQGESEDPTDYFWCMACGDERYWGALTNYE